MFLGIDIGTSGIKATIIDEKGNMCARAYRPLRTYGLEERKRELSPVQVKEETLQAVAEVLHTSPAEEIRLITVASLGEAVVPVGADGCALMNSIIGSDSRGSEELEEVACRIGEEQLTEITGLNLSYIYSLNKMLYIRAHYPEIHRRVWKYMCFTDYIGFVLTGEAVIDYSMASRTMAFDIRKKRWSDEILNAVQMSKDLLSHPVPGGTVAGSVRKEIKEELGIFYDIPVLVGSHDHIFNAIGAGAIKPGICSNTVGTTEGITTVLGGRIDSRSIRENLISCEPFVRPHLYNTVAWHNAAGAGVNWFLDNFFGGSEEPKDQTLAGLNGQQGHHPSNLLVVPHFAGATAGHMDEKAKAAVIGITMATGREEIYKAILEGTAFECRVILDSIRHAGIPVNKVVVSGGGSRSSLWMQIRSSILGRELYCSACADTGALGGAVLGAVVLGLYRSLKDAAGQMVRPGTVVEPEAEAVRIYEERYELYRQMYGRLRDINERLS